MTRTSFPTAISLIALFVALGGTSYAVTQLPRNSVGNAQIKTNAITAGKIRNGTIGPKDLNSSAAGRRGPRGPVGPAGPAGTGSATGSTLTPWQPLQFVSWNNYGSPYDTAAYRIDGQGMVHLRGVVTAQAGLPVKDEVIVILPAGARPAARKIFSVQSGAAIGRVDVHPDGNVTWLGGGVTEKDYTSLSGISFFTD